MWLWCVRLGRRRSMIAYYAIAGIALISSQVIPEQAGDWDRLTCVVTSYIWCIVISTFALINEVNLRRTRLVLRVVTVSGSIPGAGHLFQYVTNQPPKANSAFHPSGVGKWVPASAGKAKALCTLRFTERMHRCLFTNSWTSLAKNLTDLTTFATTTIAPAVLTGQTEMRRCMIGCNNNVLMNNICQRQIR